MEFKRYDNSGYQVARDASKWGKADPSLDDTVNGILKFMHRKGIISVAPRAADAASSPDESLVVASHGESLVLTDAPSATAV